MTRLAVAVLACVTVAMPAAAQIRVNPTGVNVNAQGATTVFLTFGGLRGQQPAEALWCGELMPATPDIGLKCAPGTIFGSLPLRFDRSRASGAGGFTDIMSIPPSVARRAYQAAEAGENSAFFYVRRFVSPIGGPDEYVAVTCRLAGGGARVPLALLDVRLAFEVETPLLHLQADEPAPALEARITYNGTGRLKGRWEVVLPGEEPPLPDDLLTEATLPVERRGTQRRYAEIGRFNVFLPPVGRYTLRGPDPARLPRSADGLYTLLLRIEASDDKEADSNLAAVGAGPGIVHAGAVAGFPMPVLRYVVGSGGSSLAPASRDALVPLLPVDGTIFTDGAPVDLTWTELAQAAWYRLEIDAEGQPVHAALLTQGGASYRVPPFVKDKVPTGRMRWRVAAFDAAGRQVGITPWRMFTIAP